MNIGELIDELKRIAAIKGEYHATNVIEIASPTYNSSFTGNSYTFEVEADSDGAETVLEQCREYAECLDEAKSRIEYYETDDFRSDYEDCLYEGYDGLLSKGQQDKFIGVLYEYFGRAINEEKIRDNIDAAADFIAQNPKFTTYRGYESVNNMIDYHMFGEQQEQVEYWTPIKAAAYSDAGFYIDDKAMKPDWDEKEFTAFYDMSDCGLAWILDYEGEERKEIFEILDCEVER